MNEYLNQIEISGITYDLVASGGTGSGVTPTEVQEMIEDYTYDKQTIDDKIASGGGESIIILSGDVITLSGDVISLSGDVQIISGDIITLSAETNALETKLDTLSGEVIDNEQVVSAALNDLKANKLDASAYTPTDLSNYYKKSETSGKTEIQSALDLKQDKLTAGIGITIIDNVISSTGGSASGVTSGDVQNMLSAYTYDKDEIDDKLSEVSEDVITISGDVITLSGNVYSKSETSGKTELDAEFAKYYKKDETSSKTEIDDALALKVNVVDNQVPQYGLKDKLVEEGGRNRDTYTADSYSNGAVYFSNIGGGYRNYDIVVVDKDDNVVFSGTGQGRYVDNDYFTLHTEKYDLEYEGVVEAKSGYRFTRVTPPVQWGAIPGPDFYTLKYYTQVTKFDSYQSSSAITYNIYPELDKIESEKQDKLTVGNGIKINGNEISVDYDMVASLHQLTAHTADTSIHLSSGDVVNIVSGYSYSKDEVDEKIESAITASGVTSGDVQTMIDEAVSGKVDTDDFIVVRDTVVDVVNAVNDINDDITSLSGDSGTLKLSAFTNAEYDSTNKVINFYNLTGGTVASIDATEFIKDGMIDSVSVSGTDLIITFNTESGHEDIVISLADIFNPDNYYTKTEVYNKVEIDNKFWCGSESDWAQISGSTQSGVLYLIY